MYRPTESPIDSNEELEANVHKLVEELEDYEDVLRVWTTLDMPEGLS